MLPLYDKTCSMAVEEVVASKCESGAGGTPADSSEPDAGAADKVEKGAGEVGAGKLGELDKCVAALEKEPESAAKEVMERVMGCQTRLLLLSGCVRAVKTDGQVLHG